MQIMQKITVIAGQGSRQFRKVETDNDCWWEVLFIDKDFYSVKTFDQIQAANKYFFNLISQGKVMKNENRITT